MSKVYKIMKKVYINPITEITSMNASTVLCASGDPVSSAPVLTVPGSGDKENPKTAAY